MITMGHSNKIICKARFCGSKLDGMEELDTENEGIITTNKTNHIFKIV